MESIPEVLEDKDSIREQVDSGSVHDMDYVNPRGVRFTQSTQRDGNTLSSQSYTHNACVGGCVWVGEGVRVCIRERECVSVRECEGVYKRERVCDWVCVRE